MTNRNKVKFVRHDTAIIRRHYINENDVKVVLSRVPQELWDRLKKIHFKDDARGNRILGYTTNRGRREISLCALPHRLSLNRVLPNKPEEFGALRGNQWPTIAIRRFMLYDTLLHEIGHLQIISPQNSNPNRKFAHETKAQAFANHWRRLLWSQPFDHPDPVHNPPSEQELQMLKSGWMNSHSAYRQGLNLEKVKREEAISYYQQALDLYAYHTLALERLGIIFYVYSDNKGKEYLVKAIDLLRQAIAIDPMLWDATIYLAMGLDRLNEFEESRRYFEQAMVLEPYQSIAIAFYADALSHRGYLREAEKLFQTALKKKPNWDLLLLYYAKHLMYREKDFHDPDTKAAILLLLQAIELNPNDASNHYYLGLAYSWLTGYIEQAIFHTKEALHLKPTHKLATELLANLVYSLQSKRHENLMTSNIDSKEFMP